MAVYLVTKNNLKRVFHNKLVYLWMVLIPVLIVLIGSFSTSITENNIHIGVIGENPEIIQELDSLPYVEYQPADSQSIKTSQIMGTYQYVMNLEDHSETAKTLELIKSGYLSGADKESENGISSTGRIFAMLMTAYMVIATLYALKYIQDCDMGTVARFRLSGAGKTAYFWGYVLSTAVIVTVQIVIATLILLALEGISVTSIVKLILVILLMIVVATTYGVLHAFLYKREMVANIISSSVAIVLSILGGTFVAVESMPTVLQYISIISPIRWILLLLS